VVDNGVLFHDVANVLVRFKDAVTHDDTNEQERTLRAFAELFAVRAASACPVCTARISAPYN
jgi:hypothetical protein